MIPDDSINVPPHSTSYLRTNPLASRFGSVSKRMSTTFELTVNGAGRFEPQYLPFSGESESGPSYIYEKKEKKFFFFRLCIFIMN